MADDTYRKAELSDVPALSKLAHRALQPHAHAPEVSAVEVNATEYSIPFYRRQGFHPLSGFIDYEGCRFARLGDWRKNPLLPK